MSTITAQIEALVGEECMVEEGPALKTVSNLVGFEVERFGMGTSSDDEGLFIEPANSRVSIYVFEEHNAPETANFLDVHSEYFAYIDTKEEEGPFLGDPDPIGEIFESDDIDEALKGACDFLVDAIL